MATKEKDLKETTNEFKPQKVKYYVRSINRSSGLVTDPTHENYFLFGDSNIKFSLPASSNNSAGDRLVLVNPFSSKEEREYLENETGLSLSHTLRDNNFWVTRQVTLGKTTRVLDMSNPYDHIDYLILSANKDVIAIGGLNKFKKASYKFVIEDEDFEIDSKVHSFSVKKDAMIEYGKVEHDKKKLLSILKLYGRRISEDSKLSFIQSQVGELLEKDPKTFLELIKDVDFEIKLVLEECVEYNVITRERKQYFLLGGEPLCDEGETSFIETAIAYLSKVRNSELLESLKSRLESAKTKK